jgi:hypothetical protein
LRNPWGFGESLIKWSDQDPKNLSHFPQFSKYFAELEKNNTEDHETYDSEKDDGYFNMCFKDW